MPMIRRSFLPVAVLLLVFNVTVSASDLEKADSLLDNAMLEEALAEYERVFEEVSDPELRRRAFYRSCDVLGMLNRYGEAADRLISTPIPRGTPHEAHILLIKAEMLRRVLSVYDGVRSGEVIDDQARKDVFRLTTDEIRRLIDDAYKRLWNLRAALVTMEMGNEAYFIDVQSVDLDVCATVFDYSVMSWCGYLMSRDPVSGEELPRAALVLVEEFDEPVDMDSHPSMLAAALMEEASRFRPEGRREAAERWRIRRLLLPLRNWMRFDPSGLAEIGDVRYPRMRDAKNRAFGVLIGWMSTFKTNEARAQAGLNAAVQLKEGGWPYGPPEAPGRIVELFKRVEVDFPETEAAGYAESLRLGIERPRLDLRRGPTAHRPAEALKVCAYNLETVHVRVYRVDPERVRGEFIEREEGASGRIHRVGWGLTGLFGLGWCRSDRGEDLLESWLKEWTPLRAFSVTTGDRGKYAESTELLDLGELNKGVYLVVVCEDESYKVGESLMSAALVNITDFILLGSAGFTTKATDAWQRISDNEAPRAVDDEGFRFYALDAETGSPLGGAEISAYVYDFAHEKGEIRRLRTSKDGAASLSLPVDVGPGDRNRCSVDPLAEHEGAFSYWGRCYELGYSAPNPLRVFIESDRPIYRPGHTLRAKAVVVLNTPEGFRTVGETAAVDFIAMDANNREFYRTETNTNEFGSASVEMEIPRGRLCGSYDLVAHCEVGGFEASATVDFRVEEYKRPEFEVVLEPSADAWKYDEPVRIEGSVSYYFGGPVSGASIDYRIERGAYMPWCYRLRFGPRYFGGTDDVAEGTLKADEQGRFSIPFTPTPESRREYGRHVPDFSNFVVAVECRDSGGRTIEKRRFYRAGVNAEYYEVTANRGFFTENDAARITVRRMTINEVPVPGSSDYKVFELSDAPGKPLWLSAYGGVYRTHWIEPLDAQLEDVPNGEPVAEGVVVHGGDGRGTIELPGLSQGVYRMVVGGKDRWGAAVERSRVFVVVPGRGEAVPVNAGSVTLVEMDSYEVGDTARFVIGSAWGSGVYHVELWAGQHFADRLLVDGDDPVRVVTIPITQELKGGFTFRWFGVRDHKAVGGHAMVSVPWTEKKLTVALDPFEEKLTPGERVGWGVRVTDDEGAPVEAEVLALMYDRSLEYYATSHSRWMDGLYSVRKSQPSLAHSLFGPAILRLAVKTSPLKEALRQNRGEGEEPGIRRVLEWRSWRLCNFRMRADIPQELCLTNSVVYECCSIAPTSFDPREGPRKIVSRSRFADTAFFEPHIVTSGEDGRARFTFVTPDQLTGWRVKLFAFTPDAREGTLKREAVSTQDFAVRVDVPRFFRENDTGTVTAIVHNEGERSARGRVLITVTQDGETVNSKLALEDNERKFVVEPGGLATFHWTVEVPAGTGVYKVRVAALAGDRTDAEERILPILPSRERLMESACVALTGSQSKELKISLRHDPTRVNELMVLSIEPQLALSILNSLPDLLNYPHACVEQTLNKYVPLSLVNAIYEKYPAVRRAVEKTAGRRSADPESERSDTTPALSLLESPWVARLTGRHAPRPAADLLDPDLVEGQRDMCLSRLKAAQLGNGGFPWWPGGEADPYMTLYVLAGFAELERYGIRTHEYMMIGRALDYVINEIPRLPARTEARQLALASYAAYVVTAFDPQRYYEAKEGHESAKTWVKYLKQHVDALTPLGKAYLSYTCHRLGDKEKAEELLDLAMVGAREDAVAGVYWTPEKYSWVWYSDTVEKHAFFLRALQSFRPNDKRIPGMVRWLLFNRKGNSWKSTKASAAAVYSLLDHMHLTGALTADETFKVNWGESVYSETVGANDWLDQPIRWRKAGPDAAPDTDTATIEKTGPGIAFASMTRTYSTDRVPEASAPGILKLDRKFYRRVKEGDEYHLKLVGSGDTIRVGEQIEVRLEIGSRSQFEYMHLNDPGPAGFESENLLSGWRYDGLYYYQERRDSLTNFFLDRLPHGEYVLSHRLRPTKEGVYRVGAATLQSMYSPDMTAHSAGFVVKVVAE